MSERHTILEQLGRWWVDQSSWATHALGGTALTFAETAEWAAPGSDGAPANVYPCPLPDRKHRLSPACSLTLLPGGSSGQRGWERVTRFTVVCFSAADTARKAVALLMDLRRLLRPTEGPIELDSATGAVGGFDYRGLIGLPASVVTGDSAFRGWRIGGVEIAAEPSDTTVGGGLSSQAGDSAGGATAEMTIEVWATPATIPAA